MQSQKKRKLLVVLFMLAVLAAAVSSFGDEQEESPPVEFTGVNVEASSTADRDLIKWGVWLTDHGKLINTGLYYTKKKNEAMQYGLDTAIGYLTPVYRVWPFVQVGVRIGADTSIKNFHAEAYPKAGIAVPLSSRILMYADYQYSYSSQGRHHDYSAASVGFVWGLE